MFLADSRTIICLDEPRLIEHIKVGEDMTHSDTYIEPESIVDPYVRSLAVLDRRVQSIRAVGYLLTRHQSAPDTEFVPAGCGAIICREAHAVMAEIDHLRGMERSTPT